MKYTRLISMAVWHFLMRPFLFIKILDANFSIFGFHFHDSLLVDQLMIFILFCFIVTILFHSILPYRDTVNCSLFHQWCADTISSSVMNNTWRCHLTHTASVAVINDNVDNQLADPGVNRLHCGGACWNRIYLYEKFLPH